MKFLLSALSHVKFLLVPPFAALVVWMLTSCSSSIVKYVIPRVLSMLDILRDVAVTYYTSDPSSSLGAFAQMWVRVDDGIISLVRFCANWVYGLSFWFPVGLVFNTLCTLLLLEIAYVIVRYVVKLVTLGQV